MNTLSDIKCTYLTIFITLITIIICLFLNLPIYLGLFTGLVTSIIISFVKGFNLSLIFNMIFKGVKNAFIVIIMLSIIGIMISIWMASGTIPSMIYYGFKYLSGSNIILAAFLICSMISMVLGTALGTISTIGTVFISLGIGLGLPLAPLVGAIVSGSYLGDRTSPMSSSANLTAVITGTNIIDNIKHMMITTIPVYLITSTIYWFIGNKFINTNYDFTNISTIQEILISNFNITILSLLPPIIILLTSVVLRFSIIKSITLGLISSILIYVFRDGASLYTLFMTSIHGYHSSNPTINEIVSGGGFISMVNVLLVIVFSTGLNGILDGTGMIKPLIDGFSKGINNFKDLIYKTSILSIIITIVTCNQTLSSIIPGQYLKGIYESHSVPKNTLARTISDTGIIIVPLIPWNVNAIVVSSILGISALKYIPFAYLCYLLPTLTFVYPNFNRIKLKKEGVI